MRWEYRVPEEKLAIVDGERSWLYIPSEGQVLVGDLGEARRGVARLLLAGLVTVLPLLWFNMAAQRLALSVVGFFQYLAPSITFLLAVFFWNETFTRGHAVAFASIWTALALISMEQFRNMHKHRRTRASHG